MPTSTRSETLSQTSVQKKVFRKHPVKVNREESRKISDLKIIEELKTYLKKDYVLEEDTGYDDSFGRYQELYVNYDFEHYRVGNTRITVRSIEDRIREKGVSRLGRLFVPMIIIEDRPVITLFNNLRKKSSGFGGSVFVLAEDKSRYSFNLVTISNRSPEETESSTETDIERSHIQTKEAIVGSIYCLTLNNRDTNQESTDPIRTTQIFMKLIDIRRQGHDAIAIMKTMLVREYPGNNETRVTIRHPSAQSLLEKGLIFE